MPPVNDDFAAATVLSGSSGSLTFSTVGATSETGEPANAEGHSVWFRWTAAADGELTVRTDATPLPTWDSFVAVYTGSGYGSLSLVGHDDDGAPQPGSLEGFGTSLVTVAVTAGETYHIQVTAWDDVSGPVERSNAKLGWHYGLAPPIGIIFTNAAFGPALKIGETLDVTADNGLAGVTAVNFTGAVAVPTVLSDTHLTVVVPIDAVVGPVSLTRPDGVFDSGYVDFYPWITLPWRDSPPTTEDLHLAEASRDTRRDPPPDDRWDLGALPFSHDVGRSWMSNGDGRGFGWNTLGIVSEVDDSTATGGDIRLDRDDAAGGFTIGQFGLLVDLNIEYGAGGPFTPNRFTGDFSDLPPDVYHPGDPADVEYEDKIAGDVDFTRWMTAFVLHLPLVLQSLIDIGSTAGDAIFQARAVPVGQLEYDLADADVSARQGRWFPGADLAGFPLLGQIHAGTTLAAPATLDLTLAPSQVRLDQTNGSHALIVLHFEEQITHVSGLGDLQQAHVAIDTSSSGHIPLTYEYLPPRWRYVVPQYEFVPPPQRQFPRDDGLAISARRSLPVPTTVQYGQRRGPTAIR